jgi:sugar phosphate isomerase/epimerase
VDWEAAIEECRKYGGTEWITLEQEPYPDGKTPMEAMAISFSVLKKMLAG